MSTRNAANRRRAAGGGLETRFLIGLRLSTAYCELCFVLLDEVRVDLDHVRPVAVGGLHSTDNVRFICKRCNQQRPKSGKDAIGWSVVGERDRCLRISGVVIATRQAAFLEIGNSVVSGDR